MSNQSEAKKRALLGLFQDIGKIGYHYEKVLGVGSLGTVVLAEDVQKKCKVAIKIINKRIMTTNAKLKREVEREVKIMKLLRHKHLIGFFKATQDKKYVYIILEYADEGDLFQIVRKKKLTEEEIFHYFSQILDGIQYLHSKLICHRDLKPENILLVKNPFGTLDVKISDFGLSNLLDDTHLAKTSCGSPHYASPEVILGGEGGYDGMIADVWSLGVVLYALSTNCLPFNHKSKKVEDILRTVVAGVYTFPPNRNIDPTLKDLITKMIVKDPSKRIKIKDVKKHPWYTNQAKLSKWVEHEIHEEEYYYISDKDLSSDVGKTILKIFQAIHWVNEGDLVKKLKAKKKDVESVLYRLIESRILEKEDVEMDKYALDLPLSQSSDRLVVGKKAEDELKMAQEGVSHTPVPMEPVKKKKRVFVNLFKKLAADKKSKKGLEIKTLLSPVDVRAKLNRIFLEFKIIYKDSEKDSKVIELEFVKVSELSKMQVSIETEKKMTVMKFTHLQGNPYSSELFFVAIREFFEETPLASMK